MSEFTYAGVYIQEKPGGPGPITGVTTSNLGLIGFTTKGPVDEPILCSSFSEFADKFGSFTSAGLLPTMAYAFFQNNGQRLYVVRVAHDDAAEAVWDYNYTPAAAEDLGNTAVVAGTYDLQADHVPILPGSVTLTFANAGDPTKVNVFKDDVTDGVLTFNVAASGGAAGGGTGSIDYVTGEMHIQLTVPGDYTGGADHQTLAYTYRVFRFEMQWPGLAGNYFRVAIQPGSDDYLTSATASWSRFTVLVQEDVNADALNPSWTTVETFADLVLDDPTHANFIATVMNDTINGSQYVTVTTYGNDRKPIELQGVSVTSENFYATQEHSDGSSAVVPDPYDGAWKGWMYDLANAVFPTTYKGKFTFIETDTRIGTATTPANAVANVTSPGASIVASSLTLSVNITGVGVSTLTSNGAGDILHGATVVGAINYTTGAISSVAGANTLSFVAAAHTLVAGSAITMSCTYSQPVTVIDDGDGGLSIANPATLTPPVVGAPTKFELNAAGTNTIDYDTGEVILTWKIAGDPSAGPDGVASVATAAHLDGGIQTYAVNNGDSFTLNVDGVGALPVAFVATQAHIDTTCGFPVADLDGLTTIFDIDGVSQTVTFAGVTTAKVDVLAQINAQLIGASAFDAAGEIRVQSDVSGTDSVADWTLGGTADAILTFGATVPPVGNNVANKNYVTALEMETIIEAATTAEVTVNIDGSFTVYSPTTGVASTLVFTTVTAGLLATLGFAGVSPITVIGTPALVGGELADYYTAPSTSVTNALTGGLDGSATTSADLVSPLLAAEMRGLYAFGQVDELMQLVAADFQTDTYVSDALLTYAELMKDKFVILTVPNGLDYQQAVTWKKLQLMRYSSYGALYYPHIKIRDPLTEVTVEVPCGGHVAGVYARTDLTKNCGKAPAGMEDGVLAWSVGLEYDLTPAQAGYVYENKINPLVQWPYTGRCVWGARSLDAAGGEWPYLQVRRLFMFVEKSVFKATHIHVFKNNGAQLWNDITAQLTNFLTGLYQGGYLAGTSAKEAFFVICNRTNNPQNTVDQGIVVCDVGIAGNKPAEFLVFRFTQKSL